VTTVITVTIVTVVTAVTTVTRPPNPALRGVAAFVCPYGNVHSGEGNAGVAVTIRLLRKGEHFSLGSP
jgi:hypothetical protein